MNSDTSFLALHKTEERSKAKTLNPTFVRQLSCWLIEEKEGCDYTGGRGAA
jgi:hypothetical protein